jgi:4-hydroxy-tetrahydrodipicolinate synthase
VVDQRAHAKTTFVVSITPFAADGTLSEDGMRRHLRRLAAAGMGVYVVGSGSSEAYTLSPQEIDTSLAIAVEELKGVVPLRAMGWEPRTAAEVIAFARKAVRAGVDAVQVYSPDIGHGVVPTRAALEAYYRTVLEAVDAPVVIATHESAGYKLPLDLLQRITADYPQVIGINTTHYALDYLVSVIDELDSRLEVHVGGTQQAFACLALGGTGYMIGEGNLAPVLCQSVTDRYEQGDIAGCRDAFAQVLRLTAAANGAFGSIRGIKAALAALGLPGGPTRPPLPPVGPDEQPQLRRLLDVVAGRALDAL